LRLTELADEDVRGAAEIEIDGLTADSRRVRPGWLFAALPGARADGLDFLDAALANGAAAVLARPDPRLADLPVPVVVDDNPRRRLALMAARLYDRQPATVAAITGTNGKTSTASFLRQLWQAAGVKAASLGTLGVVAPGLAEPLEHTTPEPVTLHRWLAELAGREVTHLAMEASSHGLDQCRLDGVRLAAGAFTSFTRDHLDYHADAGAYLAAKLRLMRELLPAGAACVVNWEMDVAPAVAEAAKVRRLRLLRYGRAEGLELRLLARENLQTGQRLSLEVLGLRVQAELPVVGDFQAENALAALGLAIGCGLPAQRAAALLPALRPVKGRLDHAATLANGATVFVDYAHTPDALERALEALRPHVPGRIVALFGCGGDRDRGKRPLMGAAVARHAEVAIVTDDNPRTEDAAAIRRAALAGCPGGIEIADRAAAIRHGISLLGPGDALLLAGKGHEQGQIVGTEVRPFDDAEEARKAVAALARGGA